MGRDDLDAADPRSVALAVARRLREAGHDALLCGGAVRDRLLGRTPGDYDVATSAPPEVGARLFPRAILVGEQFGVVVVVGRHHRIEVASFRADGLYVDGRRPENVRFSDPVQDAARRDFTVNALFEDPETGDVIDHVGGRRDIKRRLLCAIGDPAARFREDHLRMLRAIRLTLQLDFAIEPATFSAIQSLCGLVAKVSSERVRVELVKCLRHGRGRALRLLAKSGILEVVLPEVAAMQGVEQPAAFHPEGDVFVHTCLALDALDIPPESRQEDADDLLLGALLHDVAKPVTASVDVEGGRIRFNRHDGEGAVMAEAILRRLRFPKRTVERVVGMVATHMRFPDLPRMRPARLRRFLGAADFDLRLRLHEADCIASHGDTRLVGFCEARLAEWAEEPLLPEPILRGRDLLGLGYLPGPRMGEILGWVRDLQLEGRVQTSAEAVRLVRDRFPISPPEG